MRQSREFSGVSRSKRQVPSLLIPTSHLGLARTNDCAQHSHPSAAIRAIFIPSIICVTVHHSETENRAILPEMSNCYCHSGRAGGSPHPLDSCWQSLVSCREPAPRTANPADLRCFEIQIALLQLNREVHGLKSCRRQWWSPIHRNSRFRQISDA
jgi:hypothetical protein